MTEYKENLKRLAVISAIIVGISLSKNTGVVRNKINLEQKTQKNIIASPDATFVDIPIHYSQLIDPNYFKTQKDSSYITQ